MKQFDYSGLAIAQIWNKPRMTELFPSTRWPSGDYIELAVLKLDELLLTTYFGGRLLEGDEAGLGPWRSIGAQLKSGSVIELISFLHQPAGQFTLRLDSASKREEVIDEVIDSLGLDRSAVLWVAPNRGDERN
ncbi:hypothetical protein [Lysobacter sp. Hz 25]|uniref:hypothetical protein n=1 Tax=Lysobacter sp. Hz 25 TaxID=3383698 RepID=UPI0038D4B6E2